MSGLLQLIALEDHLPDRSANVHQQLKWGSWSVHSVYPAYPTHFLLLPTPTPTRTLSHNTTPQSRSRLPEPRPGWCSHGIGQRAWAWDRPAAK
ncbi:hypothetical protein EON65_54655 [archaeon]|nr:MAG: hypothetical protein EON65_54655 [archaeon]